MTREGANEQEYEAGNFSNISGFSSTPRPLVREMPPPDPFPIGALSGVLGDAAAAIHDLSQAPMAMCAQSVLAAATLAVQGHADVELPTGQKRPTSCFFLSVADSGERKSRVDDLAVAAIAKHEASLREIFDDEYSTWRNANDVYEKQRSQILGDKKHYPDQTTKQTALEALGEAPGAPLTPILVCGEPTYEGLVKMLIQGQPSVGVFSAEGGQFVGGHGMSPDNKLRTAAGLSSLWDGSPIKRVRAGDGTNTLPGRRVSMHLMAQSGVMATMLADPMLMDQGLLSRVLLIAPLSASGNRLWREPAPASKTNLRTYDNRLLSILEMSKPLADGKSNELTPRTLPLSEEARAKWIAFSDHVEGLISPGGVMEPIKGLANKLAEHSARIAAVLALVENMEAENVSGSHMDAGVDLVQHYAGEALRLFASGAISPNLRQAQNTLDWLWTSWNKPEVSLPDIYQRGPNAIRTKTKATRIVNILLDHGWLETIEGAKNATGKRSQEMYKIVQVAS
jgi:hypothetical protein